MPQQRRSRWALGARELSKVLDSMGWYRSFPNPAQPRSATLHPIPPPRRRPPSERRLRWAELLKRTFKLDALRCPVSDGKMRVLAAITQPDVARRILTCLSLPPRAPPIAPATLLVGQPRERPGMDVLEIGLQGGSDSLCEFDQTPPEDWDLDPQSAEHSTETARSSS
jgi:hypothetical protein